MNIQLLFQQDIYVSVECKLVGDFVCRRAALHIDGEDYKDVSLILMNLFVIR